MENQTIGQQIISLVTDYNAKQAIIAQIRASIAEFNNSVVNMQNYLETDQDSNLLDQEVRKVVEENIIVLSNNVKKLVYHIDTREYFLKVELADKLNKLTSV